MHYGLQMTVPPAVEAVSLADAKNHLRVDSDLTADDGLIQGLIIAARQYVESVTGRQLGAATFALTLDWFPGYAAPGMSEYPYGDFYAADRGWDEKRTIRLRRPPLQSVTSVAYVATDGASTALGSTLYVVDSSSEPARLEPAYSQIWPVTRAIQNAVVVTYVAGYPCTTFAASIAAGNRTVTPLTMAGIAVGAVLSVDAGSSQEWIRPTAVTSTTFTATFAKAHDGTTTPVYCTAVPLPLRQAMLLLIGHWYRAREAVTQSAAVEVPLAVDALLASFWTGEYGP